MSYDSKVGGRERVGALRYRVTIELRTDEIGSRGQSVEDWEEVEKRFASKRPLSANEQEWARQIAHDATTEFIIRRPRSYTFSSKYRLLHRGTYYNVRAVIGNDETDDCLRLLCSSGGP